MVGEEHGAGGEGLPEDLDEQVELPQVGAAVGHEAPHQLIVALLLAGRRLLVRQREAADVLLVLVEHVHQHLEQHGSGGGAANRWRSQEQSSTNILTGVMQQNIQQAILGYVALAATCTVY